MANASYYYTNFAKLPEYKVDLTDVTKIETPDGVKQLANCQIIAYDSLTFREMRLNISESLHNTVMAMNSATTAVLTTVTDIKNKATEVYTEVSNEWNKFHTDITGDYNTLSTNIKHSWYDTSDGLSALITRDWNELYDELVAASKITNPAALDASNLTSETDKEKWREALEIDSVMLDNAAKRDASNIAGYESQWRSKLNIYSKSEVDTKIKNAVPNLQNYKEDGTELSILSADTTHIYNHTIIGRDTEDNTIKTGCKAFRLASNIEHVSSNTYRVVLSNISANVSYSKLSSTAYKATTSSKLLSGLSVGDVLSINNGAKYYNVFTITKKEGNGIVFTTTNKTATTLASSVTSEKESYNFYIYCLNAPEQGIIDISDGTALAVGIGTQALNEASVATGGNTVAYGNYSFTSGRGTKAGYAAFATGKDTTASGEQSHAEGSKTIASANHSHAEGYSTKAYGHTAHSEGYGTTASGESAHSEGRLTKATGNYSHAEGELTEAQGKRSHAEGYYTVASGENQLVIGKYNKSDNNQAFIIGNGTNTGDKRSNALTVDWNGSLVAGSSNQANANNQTIVGTCNAPDTTALFQVGNGESLPLGKSFKTTGGVKIYTLITYTNFLTNSTSINSNKFWCYIDIPSTNTNIITISQESSLNVSNMIVTADENITLTNGTVINKGDVVQNSNIWILDGSYGNKTIIKAGATLKAGTILNNGSVLQYDIVIPQDTALMSTYVNRKNAFSVGKTTTQITGNAIIGGNWKETPTQLGQMAFRMASRIEADGNNYKVVLTDNTQLVSYSELTSKTYASALDTSSKILSSYKKDDVLSMINENKCYNAIKVVSINGNGLTYTVLSDNQRADKVKQLNDVGVSDFDDYTVFCLSKPTVGTVQIAPNAYSIGAGNVVNGYFGVAFGRQNQTFGNYGLTVGRENKAGYSAIALGQKNNAIGDGSFACGQANTAAGLAAAFGQSTNAKGNVSFTAGIGTEASGYCSMAVGRYNKDDENALFMVGNGSTSNKRNALQVNKDNTITVPVFNESGNITNEYCTIRVVKSSTGQLTLQLN